MADFVTHLVFAKTLAKVYRLYCTWLSKPYIVLILLGSLIPDFSKMKLFLNNSHVSTIVGQPFSWSGLHTVGGSLLTIIIGTLCVPYQYQKRAFVALSIGTVTHFLLDIFTPDFGYAPSMFWPVTTRRSPSPGHYVSSDRWPLLVMGCLYAIVSAIIDQYERR